MGEMMRLFCLALVVACLFVPPARAQTVVGYDALGRLQCVKQPSGKLTLYAYDAAGNRTTRSVAASATACGSQAAGTPPAAPVQLTSANPTVAIISRANSSLAVAALATAGDSATLVITGAATEGGAGSCGSVAHTGSSVTFTAPHITPINAHVVCYVDYLYSHPNGQTDAGRITYNISGEAS
jgi:YD repeat-containing protein